STSRLLLSFLSPRSRAHRHLHSFPTRRSSDLWRRNCCTRQEHRSRSSSSSPRATRCASTPCGSRSTANLLRTTSTAPKSSRPCRSEEHTSELQSRGHLVCRLLLEKKKNYNTKT